MEWVIIAVILVFLFIAADTLKSVMNRRPPAIKNEVVSIADERIVKLEAEVDAKMKELDKHQTERMRKRAGPSATGARPAAPMSPAAMLQAGRDKRDSMNDTKCMAAVKEKVQEIERLAEENGLSKN